LAADQVTMEVPAGEICVLLGPSGCGKTTALKMVNRLIPPTSGKIFIDDKDTSTLNDVQLRRSIGYVIQQIGLFPNMTIEDNICVVPKLLGWDRASAKKRAAELLEMVGLDRRLPEALPQGAVRRPAAARRRDPRARRRPAGDADGRAVRRHRPDQPRGHPGRVPEDAARIKKTIMFVSHDIDEAVKMGDKIAIFRAGKIEQYDSPDTCSPTRPTSFVADFVGADRTLKRLRLVTCLPPCRTVPTCAPSSPRCSPTTSCG
jgi:osmoprotectant transport system ATP-binding protein